MAIEAARLNVVVDADTAKAEAQLRQMDGTVQKTESSFGKLSGAVKGFALGGGLLAAGSVMLDMAQAAAEDAASVERLNQAVINAEGSIQGHAAALDEAVAAGQRLAFSDDQTRAALALMTAQTGDADEAMRRLSTAQNLARGAGIDLASAAKLIGKTSDENTTALSRMGIAVSDAATAQDVLNAVDQKFAGQAGAFAETDAAKFARAADSIDEMKESIGAGLLPVIVSLVEPLTTTTTIVTQLNTALGDLIGNSEDAAGSASLIGSAFAAANPFLGAFTSGMGLLGAQFGETDEQGTGLVQTFRDLAAAMPDDAFESSATGAQDYATDIERLAKVGREANDAQNEYTESLGRQAEFAGEANERNSEALQSLELIGGAAAEAAYGLDQLSEATETAWAAQDKLTGIWSDAQAEMGFWEENLSNAESALELLTGEMEENGSLTDEQQRQYDVLTQAVGRYQGGMEDTEGAVVDAAVAQANFIAIQDDLNTKLANGQISAHDYNVEMGKAAGAIDPAAGASYGLAAAQQTVADTIVGVVEKIEGLLVKLGLIPAEKKTEVSAPGATEAESQLSDVVLAADRVPRSMTIDVHVNTLQAQIALDDLRGMTYTQSPPKEGPMAFQPDFSYIFDGLDTAAEDYGTKAMQALADAITGTDITALASGELLADAQAALTDLFNAKAIAEEMDLGAEIIAEIQRQINLAQAEVNTIGAMMGTEIIKGVADAMASGEISALLADFREEVIGGLDLNDILGQQTDLSDLQNELATLIKAATELGDLETAARLQEQFNAVAAEAALLNQVIGTESVQAWITWQDEVAAAEAQAEQMAEAQDRLYQSMVTVIQGLSEGGTAVGSFIEGLVADVAAAQDALNLGLLLGVPPEVLQQLGEDLSAAEELLNQGTIALQNALIAGMVDEATLQALAEAGGEWFQTLYDSLFGVGALEELEAGWTDITDASLEQLQLLIDGMEDGGAEIIDTLVDQIAAGAISYEEALSLLSDATGEEVNAILEELQALYDALLIDLANALVTGSDPSEIEANMQIIEDLMDSLADRAVDTANQVISAGKSMARGYAASLDEMAGKVDQGFDPYGTKGGGGGSGGSGKGGSSIYDLQGIAASTYRGLDPTPSIGEFNDWKKAQMEAGLLNPNGSGNAAFYNTYHPGALSPSMGGMSAAEMHDAVYAGARDGARSGSSEGTKAGFTGWQIPVGR